MCSVTHLATTPRGECRASLHGKWAGNSERIPLGMPFPLVIIPRPRVGQPRRRRDLRPALVRGRGFDIAGTAGTA